MLFIEIRRPSKLDVLSEIDGFSRNIINKVGQRFIDCVVKFCKDQNCSMNVGLDYTDIGDPNRVNI